MALAEPPKGDERKRIPWYFSMIPFNMAIGSSSVLTTLVALSLNASVAEIGLMVASGAITTIIFSTAWGKLSDRSGIRIKYLIILFVLLGPIFLILSTANSIQQLILYYTLLAIFSSGVSPIAVMYAVEACRSRNWQREVARYNSISSIGTIFGFVINTFVALLLHVNWLFYISSILCFFSAFFLWQTAQESHITLERHAFPIRHLRDAEHLLSPRPIFHYLDIRKIQIPRNLGKFKPLHLLFLACFIHWLGIFFFNVGQTPLMKELGLSDSMILAINALSSVVPVVAFGKIVPSLKQDHKKLINMAIFSRGILIICWGALSTFTTRPFPYIFVLPLLFSVLFPFFYAVLWLPIITFAISSAPEHSKGSIQGELLSVMAVSNALGSALGGFVMTNLGYIIGFILAAIISILATPIISRINMI